MAMKDDVSAAEVEATLNQLEQKLQRLRSLYEQYFMGIERIPPHTARKEVVRLIHRLEQTHIRNTALRFRQRSLTQRFNSYKSYWNRVEKQIEEGTYKRDRQRAQRNAERQASMQRDEDGAHVIDLELEEVESLQDFQRELEELDAAGAFDYEDSGVAGSSKQAKLDQIRSKLAEESESAPRPSQASRAESKLDDERRAKLAKLKQRLGSRDDGPPSNLPTGGADMNKLRQMAAHRDKLKAEQQARTAPRSTAGGRSGDNQARAVYNKLLEAKKRCNESTSNLSYESVQKSMQKQRDQLKSSRGARDVDFKVVIKDGKAFLKPIPK